MTDPDNIPKGFSRARINTRQVDELVGYARGVLADKELTDEEIKYLHKWLVSSSMSADNPLIVKLFDRVDDVLSDNRLASQ